MNATAKMPKTFVLTDVKCRAHCCPANAPTASIRDEQVKGLELRASRHTKAWLLNYTRKSDGKRRALSLGTYEPAELTLAQARAKATTLKDAITNGGDPAAGVQARKETPTFEALAELWISDHASIEKSGRTLADDRSMLRVHINPAIGAILVTDLDVRTIASMLGRVRKAKDARFTVATKDAPDRMSVRANRVFELVRSILWWAEGQGIITSNPMKAMSPPTKKGAEVVRERTLSPDEVLKLWTALEATPIHKRQSGSVGESMTMTRAIAAPMMLSLVTGQRIGETSGIVKNELDLNELAPVWTISKERAKNGRAHRVPLSTLAVKIITDALNLSGNSAYLFPGRGKIGTIDVEGVSVRRLTDTDTPINAQAVTKAWNRSRGALGLHDANVHDLRRTALTGMAECGVPPLTISLVANHASATRGTVTMKVYIKHPYDAEKRSALEAWGARLTGIITGATSNIISLRATTG